MSYLLQAGRLLLDPPAATAAIRESRPFWRAVGLAFVVAVVYQAGLYGFVKDLSTIVRLGSFDTGAVAIIWDHLATAVPTALGFVALIAGVLTPLCLLFVGSLDRGSGPFAALREHYTGVAAAALTSYAVGLLLWLLPALLLGDPSNAHAARTWSVLPFLVVALLVAVALEPIADAGLGRASVAAGGAAALAIILPFAGTVVLVLAALGAALVGGVVVRSLLEERSATVRERAVLERNLLAVSVNPYDAAAHGAAGAIFLRRSELERAIQHLRLAVELDPFDLESLFLLGRAARLRGEYADAIARFDAVLQADPAFSSGEVWREVGKTYLAARQFDDARVAFERFLERHPTSAEGLYLHGLTLDALGEREGARRRMLDVVETVRTAPAYRYRLDRRWMREAESFLKGDEERG